MPALPAWVRSAALRRTLLAVIALLFVGAGVGLALRPHLIEAAGQRALAKVEARLGLPVLAEAVHPWGWLGAQVDRIRVGAADAPLITVRRARAALTWAELRQGQRRPQRIELSGVVLHVYGDGSLEGAARALKAALPEALTEGGATGGGGGGDPAPRPTPEIVLSDVRVVDHAGAVLGQEGHATVRDGRLESSLLLTAPPLGRCHVEGDRHGLALSCDEPLSVPLPAGFRLAGRSVEVQLKPTRQLRLTGVRLAAGEAEGRLATILGGLSADLSVTLDRDRSGRYPVTAGLRLPGGAALEIQGSADQQGAAMGAELAGFRLDPVHSSLDGLLSGTVQLQVDRATRRVVLTGQAKLSALTVTHPALAEDRIGPFTVAFGGKVVASADPEGPLERAKVALTDGTVTLGDVALTLEAAVDATGAAPVITAAASIPTVAASKVAAAIPPGLMPNLQPIEAQGRFGFEGGLRIDFADLQATELTAKLDMGGLRLTGLNPAVDFDALGTRFVTRFVMPDETVFERETGPETERWVPLEEITPLMPLAVITQEDGGFYRHGGVSLFHLRASLVRNLERGRFARGGSTLSMQLARNLFLHRRKTLARKLEELVLTWLLEQRFEKAELMALYLNVVEFGEGVFGIKDAAAYYFDKPPSQLDPVEVAFLTRLLPSPRRWGKQKEKGKADGWYVKRIDRLLDLLVDRGHLSAEVRAGAQPALLFQGPTMDPQVWQPPVPGMGADGEVPPADDGADPFAPVFPSDLDEDAPGEPDPLAPVAPLDPAAP